MCEMRKGSGRRLVICWRGSHRKIACGAGPNFLCRRDLGESVGRPEYVDAQLRVTTEKHQTLLQRIPAVPDVQSAWSLLLQCASSRANYLMRVVRPELAKSFAKRHNVGLWKCLADILHLSGNRDVTTKEVASMPLAMGGLGLRDGARISPAAFWASWADSLGMIKARHPQVANTITQGLNGEAAAPTLRAAARARHDLTGVQGFEPPSWEALADGVRPPFHDMDDGEPSVERHGWQHEAASRLEREFRERHLMPHLAAHERCSPRASRLCSR